ncbi:unnamed protein product [Toxocara canis]|uniref:Uncharacterized protein n=1 Tax=Toxocara canis TaxID=6265 RepID=A0A183VCT6_TOXCA|nr:unnamed protein product [Toxocara canis]
MMECNGRAKTTVKRKLYVVADDAIWYRKWLLVQLLNVWSELPCINWCYYAQLACPHLATSKVADYAGHPSFQCRGKY